MKVEIKPLTPDLAADYLDFFDNRAFTNEKGNNPNGPCYCNVPTMVTGEVRQMVSEFGNDIKAALRRNAAHQLAEGRFHGYLAYDGGISVGWCNAGDMNRYPVNDWRFIPNIARQMVCGKTMSIVCFAIAPDYCGKGIATALLERVIADAKREGYVVVEGYGDVQKARVSWDFHGPIQLYEKAGFVEVARCDGRIVLRKDLNCGTRYQFGIPALSAGKVMP